MKRWAHQPGLLHEFELPLDIPVQAHEQEARLLSGLFLVDATDAHDAVTIGDRDLIIGAWIEAVARIDAADMRAIRAAERFGIFRAEQEIIVAGAPRRLGRGAVGSFGWSRPRRRLD